MNGKKKDQKNKAGKQARYEIVMELAQGTEVIPEKTIRRLRCYGVIKTQDIGDEVFFTTTPEQLSKLFGIKAEVIPRWLGKSDRRNPPDFCVLDEIIAAQKMPPYLRGFVRAVHLNHGKVYPASDLLCADISGGSAKAATTDETQEADDYICSAT